MRVIVTVAELRVTRETAGYDQQAIIESLKRDGWVQESLRLNEPTFSHREIATMAAAKSRLDGLGLNTDLLMIDEFPNGGWHDDVRG
jgi:hypothetical protein